MSNQYIRDLDLAETPPAAANITAARGTPPASDTVKEPTGYVAAGSLVAFDPGVTGQVKADVLNSTLLAQLAADKKFDRQTQVTDWYGLYSEVLGRVGWKGPGFDLQTYKASSTSFTVDKAIIEIAAAAPSWDWDEPATLTAVLEGLRENADNNEGQISIFDNASVRQTQGNFQIGVCSQPVGGVFVLKTVAFTFDAGRDAVTVPFFHLNSSETDCRSAARAQTLDENIYATVRGDVITKLGDRANRFIASLDINLNLKRYDQMKRDLLEKLRREMREHIKNNCLEL